MKEKVFQINYPRFFTILIKNTIHIFTSEFLMVKELLVIFIKCSFVLFDRKLYLPGR